MLVSYKLHDPVQLNWILRLWLELLDHADDLELPARDYLFLTERMSGWAISWGEMGVEQEPRVDSDWATKRGLKRRKVG